MDFSNPMDPMTQLAYDTTARNAESSPTGGGLDPSWLLFCCGIMGLAMIVGIIWIYAVGRSEEF